LTPQDTSASVTTDAAIKAVDAAQVDAQREQWLKSQTTGWGPIRLRLTRVLAALQWPLFLGTVCLGTKLPGERLSVSFLLLGGVVSVVVFSLALGCLLLPTKHQVATFGALVLGLGVVVPASLGMFLVLPWALPIMLAGGYAYAHFLEWCIWRLDPFPPQPQG